MIIKFSENFRVVRCCRGIPPSQTRRFQTQNGKGLASSSKAKLAARKNDSVLVHLSAPFTRVLTIFSRLVKMRRIEKSLNRAYLCCRPPRFRRHVGTALENPDTCGNVRYVRYTDTHTAPLIAATSESQCMSAHLIAVSETPQQMFDPASARYCKDTLECSIHTRRKSVFLCSEAMSNLN